MFLNFCFWLACVVVVTAWILLVFAAFSDIAVALRNIAYELHRSRETGNTPYTPGGNSVSH